MAAVSLWFERKFDFSFPAELYPNVCMRLRGTPARLEELLRDRPHEVLIKKAGDKWSVQEHAGHLLDLEPLWTSRIEDFAAARAELTAADLRNRRTHEANHNGRPLNQILCEFRAARARLVELAHRQASASSSRTIPHPRLRQPMRLIDHLYFVAEHDDHHLAHMWALLEGQRSEAPITG